MFLEGIVPHKQTIGGTPWHKKKIIDVPPGQAPEWVRKAWIGLVMPVAENLPTHTIAMGVLGGKAENPNGYPVETSIAIQILKEKSPDAAQWWTEHVSPIFMRWLIFKEEVCQLIQSETK
ncbi:MAG: hypothetical protein WC682_00155 [Parcubacteria group bacterium]